MRIKKIFLFLTLATIYFLKSSHENFSFIKHKVCVIGTGYVGLVLGAGLADFGHKVICVDIDEKKINGLKKGIIPIYEKNLDDVVLRNIHNQSLQFSTHLSQAVQLCDIIFIAVGTPTGKNGEADISAVIAVAKSIAKSMNNHKIICIKSTVPIGTGKMIHKLIELETQPKITFDMASNPEFLREGVAIHDFFNPNRIVIGAESEKALSIMQEIYAPLLKKNVPFVKTDIITAETIKYASNAFLAVKISYINEIAQLCEQTDANIIDVALGMGLDERIGSKFLKPGPGFGGSCFPKDTLELLKKGESTGVQLKIVQAAIEVNQQQGLRVVKKLERLVDSLQGKNIAILGLAFKANTDDVRESPALKVIELLLEKGAIIKAYDPIAMENMKKNISNIYYAQTMEDALINADAAIILTEWDEFKNIDLTLIKRSLKKPIIIDTRNIINPTTANKLGITLENIGNAKFK